MVIDVWYLGSCLTKVRIATSQNQTVMRIVLLVVSFRGARIKVR